MKQKIYLSILSAVIFISGKTYSQNNGNSNPKSLDEGSHYFHDASVDTSNHITMSLENCSMPAGNVIQFDLDVESNGDPGSFLVPNSFQFGINFDCCILQTGDSVVPSYVPNSSQLVTLFSSNTPNPITSTIPCHIRIIQAISSAGNTGQNMILGTKYRFGTFRLTSNLNFTSFCPNFTLQDTAAANRTQTAGIVYIGSSPSTALFASSVSEDTLRLLNVACTACNCTTGIEENNATQLISFFPNPVADKLMLLLPENNSATKMKIINLLGEVKYSTIVNEKRSAIDVSALSNGVYIIEATMGNYVARHKFIVNRLSVN